MRIGIGIDTGGTCTDAVAYDFETKTLLAKGKALTTREDLSVGIGKALDMLPPELIRAAEAAVLSTTLATNACLERKGCRAKLLVFGLSDALLKRLRAAEEFGLEPEFVHGIDTHGSADGLRVDEPDWDALLAEYGPWLGDADALSAAEVYSIFNGAPLEKRFKALMEKTFSLPCVCANELSSEVNVLARGATALLNARLFPVVREFVGAAERDFAARQCSAPLMVVRSDGSLMSAELALSRPVETIMSGPAASVLAGRTFFGGDDYLIVDMGGTTTDVSAVRDGRPVMTRDGIRLGGWKTTVKGVAVESFALGGDSTVRAAGAAPELCARRAVPLCAAARRWPEIRTRLQELLWRKRVSRFPLHEFLYLVREPAEQKKYGPQELLLLRALRDGPCMLEDLSLRTGIDLYSLDSERLESEGVVMRCGLTPTDFMHIRGDYTEFDRDASILAARCLLAGMQREDTPEALEALTEEVYRLVEGRLYENLLRIRLCQRYPQAFASGAGEQTLFLIREAWKHREDAAGLPALFRLGGTAALVGIGAPTHVFLPAVAEALGAACVLPEHAEVANALGALKADIRVTVEVDVAQRLSSEEKLYYVMHAPTGSVRFDELEAAQTAAQAAAEAEALREARARGAAGDLTADTRLVRRTTKSVWGTDVHLGTTAVSEVIAHWER